jgi:hypothetical protein
MLKTNTLPVFLIALAGIIALSLPDSHQPLIHVLLVAAVLLSGKISSHRDAETAQENKQENEQLTTLCKPVKAAAGHGYTFIALDLLKRREIDPLSRAAQYSLSLPQRASLLTI